MSDTQTPVTDPYAPHLPEAVRRQIRLAEDLARQAGIANMPPAEDEPGGPESRPLGDNSGDVTTEVAPGEAAPEPQAQPATQPEPPLDEPRHGDDTTRDIAHWEQRYNTLQGKYNAEISELRGQVRAMQEMMQRQPAPEPAPPPRTYVNPPAAREIPQEDVDAYGQDLIAASQRWAEARIAPFMQEVDRRLLSVEGANQQVAQFTAQQQVENALDRTVPRWRTINTDPAFLGWLADVDPFSGRSRKQLLTEAYGAGDQARTIAFFVAFEQQTAGRPAAAGTQPLHTGGNGAMPAPAEPLPLADLAVPGRGQVSSGPVPGAQPDKRIWRASDITAFYSQKARGQWNGREAEALRIDHDIMAAGREGRVIP